MHTHGKYDSRYDNEVFSCDVDALTGVESGDLPASEYLKIQLGLVTPKGNSWLYDGRSGTRGVPQKFPPPPGVNIPYDPRYNGFIGFFKKIFD